MEPAIRAAAAAGFVGVATAVVLRLLRPPERCVLYYHPISQPGRACLSLLRAARVSPARVALKTVSFEAGEHKSAAFLAINAHGTVPALSEGTFGMGESHAIMRFLCARLRLPDHWYPREPRARARVDEYLDWHHRHTRDGVPFFFHKFMARRFGMAPDTLRLAEGRAKYEAAARQIEACFLSRLSLIHI